MLKAHAEKQEENENVDNLKMAGFFETLRIILN